jgi:hypothetical protein
MGKHDSSKTRVAPVFSKLLDSDPSGEKGQRLVNSHGTRWGDAEYSLPAPDRLLEYLVQNLDPELIEHSADANEVLAKRRALARRDASVVAEALGAIRAGKRGREWFILEAASRPDALVETQDVVLCIEGKRTEGSCTTQTTWMRHRSQLVRHMDAAFDAFPGKRILGLLIVEGDGDADAVVPSVFWSDQCAAQYEPTMIEGSLPHRNRLEREAIGDGILGVTTWQAVCSLANIDWASLPDTSYE